MACLRCCRVRRVASHLARASAAWVLTFELESSMVSALPVFVVLPPFPPLAAALPQASPESFFRLRFLVVCFVFGLRAGQCPGSQGLSMSDWVCGSGGLSGYLV